MSYSQAIPVEAPKQFDGLANAPLRLRSEALFGRAKEVLIVHNGREYRLRVTQNRKLILTA